MSGSNFQYDGYQSLHAGALIADPGDTETIDVAERLLGVCLLTSGGTETRTLADPRRAGQRLILSMIADSGDITVTVSSAYTESGVTTITFSDPGQAVSLDAIYDASGTLAWRAAAEASEIGIRDAGAFTSQTTVEGALQEILQHIISVNATIPLSLHDLREVDSSKDVGDSDANGGVLASNTTPVLRASATTENIEVFYAANDVDPVAVNIALPEDLDDTADAYVDLVVQANTTDQAPTFTVETSWDGGAVVSDSATAVTSTARQTITATIGSGDVPADAFALTIGLTPAAHGTSAFQLHGYRFRYKRKLLTA